MIFSYILAIGTIAFVAGMSSIIPKANSRTITIFFLMAVIFGRFLINMLRVLLNSLLAPLVVQDQRENDDKENSACCLCVYTVAVAEEAVDILNDMITVYELSGMEESGGNQSKSGKTKGMDEDLQDRSQNYALKDKGEHTVDNFNTHNMNTVVVVDPHLTNRKHDF